MRIRSGIAIALVLAGVAAAPAHGHTFSGSCATLGQARTVHPLTPLVPAADSFTLRAAGTCTGTLDGRPLPTEGAPVTLTSDATVTGGDDCLFGAVLTAPFTVNFTGPAGDGAKLHGLVSALDVGPVVPSVYRGLRAGHATGFDYIAGGAETVQACLAGELQAFTFSTELYTLTPLVG